jgi:hypothetical protein
MSDNIKLFCSDSLRHIYSIIGYDAIMKEIQFIHHLYGKNNTSNDTLNIVYTNTTTEVESIKGDDNTECVPQNEIINDSEEYPIKTVNYTKKYSRKELADKDRCEFILPTKKRCSLAKDNDSNMCSRHNK